ncbi:hypothetical protein ITJ38_04835 [Agreia pratensis]|uniref:Uncharacterized protein n=1 Tax=Agreia pratensis TaxID=150121 RepID=A0A1X7L179_9MICO|nr:hypothetical protein [Agreia pratensis]MBF4633726.1 hypothetical protein [Agreia pratensis]SMG47173.1 hypothetical protein SAMN06296010_3160 [Agreia pratensis]
MTLSPDEQPLTRRQLRELERTMPKKDRQDAAKVQEEAARRAAEADASAIPDAPEQEAAAGSDESVTSETEASQTSDATEVVEDAVVVEEPTQAIPTFEREAPQQMPSPVGARGASDPISSFAPEASEPKPIVEELVIDEPQIDEPRTGDVRSDDSRTDDVPIDDDPDDGDSVTEITVESLSSGPILAPIFQPPAVVPDEQAPAKTDDSNASFDDLISSRTVGSTNSSQTSALVLPAVPSSMDMGTALDETGEVIITGSIDLPSSMGASGAPAAGIESKDLDALLDIGETEQSGDDVAPVSASRAVSTGASNNALVAPPKRGRANVPVVLAITAGVLAIGVVGLLLAAFVFRIF